MVWRYYKKHAREIAKLKVKSPQLWRYDNECQRCRGFVRFEFITQFHRYLFSTQFYLYSRMASFVSVHENNNIIGSRVHTKKTSLSVNAKNIAFNEHAGCKWWYRHKSSQCHDDNSCRLLSDMSVNNQWMSNCRYIRHWTQLNCCRIKAWIDNYIHHKRRVYELLFTPWHMVSNKRHGLALWMALCSARDLCVETWGRATYGYVMPFKTHSHFFCL